MKIALLLAVLAALSLTGVASADPPQGHLTGGASLTTSIGIDVIGIVTPITDGEQVYVAKRNDKSNDCDGDTGFISVSYVALPGGSGYTIACAHFTGSGRMAFTYFDTTLNTNVVLFIVDVGVEDRVYVGSTTDGTLAMQWVNRGWNGSGAKTGGLLFPQVTVAGDYIVTA